MWLLFSAIYHLSLQWIAHDGILPLHPSEFVRHTQLQLRFIFGRGNGWPHFSSVSIDGHEDYLFVFRANEIRDIEITFLAIWQKCIVNGRTKYSRVLIVHGMHL